MKKHDILEATSVSVFRQRSTSSGGPLRLGYSQSMGTIETITFLRYAPENRYNPRVVTGK